MDPSPPTDFGVDVENDDFETVAAKLDVKVLPDSEKFVLGEDQLRYLNDSVDDKNETLLMRYIRLRKEKVVEFLLRCDGLNVNATNRGETAADLAWRNNNYVCLLKLLEADSFFPKYFDPRSIDEKEEGAQELKHFLDERLELLEHIESGELELVKEKTKRQRSSLYLNLKNKSALYRAAKNEQLEVFTYLLFIGAGFKDTNEAEKCRFDEFQKDELEVSLEEYFIRDDKSHVFKLMASSKALGEFTDKQKEIVGRMYNYLNNSKLVSLLMKVAAYEDVDIVYDFKSEYTDRICHSERGEIRGLSISRYHRIYIGAKSSDSEMSLDKNVAGTIAHEICHLAMNVLYGNWDNPYKNGDSGAKAGFDRVVDGIKGRLKDVDEVIRSVFDYDEDEWHCELIVRVPHILALYGETEGRKKLLKQVPELYKYYLKVIVPACEKYTEEAFFTKPICIIQSLQKYHGCIQEMEMRSRPLNESFQSFRDYLNRFENLSILVTSNTKLCCLHVFHELKEIYHYQVEKQCLFFKLDCFHANAEKIINAFRCKACHYMVLVTRGELPNLSSISNSFDGIVDDDQKNVILIVSTECKGLKPELREKVLDYKWNDFSVNFKELLMRKKFNFKSKSYELRYWMSENELSKFIAPEDLLRLTEEDGIEIGDGKKLFSHGYDENYFMERFFIKLTVEKSIFDGPPDSFSVLITGLRKEELEGLVVGEDKIQLVEDPGEKIGQGKWIFLPKKETKANKIFEDFFELNVPENSVHWLHYLKGEFYWRSSRGNAEILEKYIERKRFTEETLIEASKDRVVLISDDPGTGKSTVMSDMIRMIRDRWPGWWVGRIDLNEFADDEDNPLGLANIKTGSDPDEVITIFVKMLGLKTSLEVYLFKQLIKPNPKLCICKTYKIFFDGFDEVCPMYKQNAMKLLQTVKKETTMQIWITTRKHESADLETELGTFSYNMERLKDDLQASFLDKFWKYKMKALGVEKSEKGSEKAIEMIGKKAEAILEEMKRSVNHHYELKIIISFVDLKEMIEGGDSSETHHDKLFRLRSHIEKLNFTYYVWLLLEHARNSIKDEERQFTGLPLHLYMLGSVAYDKNLTIDAYSNIHDLYSDFVEGKVRIYWKEKCRIQQGTKGSKYQYSKEREEIIKCHKQISGCILKPERFPWALVKGSNAVEHVLDIGMVTKAEDNFQFIHRTFAEYFFSEWIVDNIRSRQMNKAFLEEVLLEPRYEVVRRFLDSVFESEVNGVEFPMETVEELEAENVFVKFIGHSHKGDWTKCANIWRDIMGKSEKIVEDNLTTKFVFDVSSAMYSMHYRNLKEVFRLIDCCLNDDLLMKLFDTHYDMIGHFVMIFIPRNAAETVAELLVSLKRVLCVKAYRASQNQPLDVNLQGNVEQMNRLFEDIRVPHGIRETLRLLEEVNIYEENIFQMASLNRDAEVLGKVLAFAKGIVGAEPLRKHLFKKNLSGQTLLHKRAGTQLPNIATVMREIKSTLDDSSYVELLKEKDNNGNNFIYYVDGRDSVSQILECLREVEGRDMFREILAQENKLGASILHFRAGRKNLDAFEELLRAARQCMDEEEFFEYLRRQNVFHARAESRMPLVDLKTLENYANEEQLRELLAGVDDNDETCLHAYFSLFCGYGDYADEGFADIFRFVSEFLDPSSMEDFLLRITKQGNTFLHLAAAEEDIQDYTVILEEVKRVLPDTSFSKLINIVNNRGKVVKIVHKDASIDMTLYKKEE